MDREWDDANVGRSNFITLPGQERPLICGYSHSPSFNSIHSFSSFSCILNAFTPSLFLVTRDFSFLFTRLGR